MEQYAYPARMSLSAHLDQRVSNCSSLAKHLRPTGLFSLGEACIRGDLDPHGIEHTIINLVKQNAVPASLGPRAAWTFLTVLLRDSQRGEKAFEVADAHYNLGNDLFQLMLDKSMSYTCGYWKNSSTLEAAQQAKLDILCKKLKLSPGQTVLDIGCGWGNFAYHAASNYGVSVVGLTVSKEQQQFAQERCKHLPVQILLQSYENFRGQFDCVVSIEMIEAVGKRNLNSYYSMIYDCLRPGGLAAIQAISAESFSLKSNRALDQFLMWLMRHIFPNGYVPNIEEITVRNASGLIVEDVENFSVDYEKTLRCWRDNFEQGWSQLQDKYGESFYRMWLYYLGGCIAFFNLRLVQLYQVVYSKNGISGGYERV